METNNLKLWESVEKTDPNHTKKAKVGGISITSIAPQYQILNATREFGPYGVKWGFSKIELDYGLIDKYNIVVFKGTFFCPDGESQIISSSKMYMDRNMQMVDADFAKKIETDALTKALSKLGFNADIFMGRYDDIKYFNEVTEEFKNPKEKQVLPSNPNTLSDERFKAALKALSEGKTTKQEIIKHGLTPEQTNQLNKS